MKKEFTIALCYDFDGTLSPANMQEYSFIPQLQKEPKTFWSETCKIARKQDADEILAYMYLMCDQAKKYDIKIRQDDFVRFGKSVKFYKGLVSNNGNDWFSRINAYAKEKGAVVKHYIISSGIKEMIEGTAIAKNFHKIYASSFMYDLYGVAMWPAQAVNYTTKMNFLFRINKGIFDVQKSINNYMPERLRPVPFKRMIYFGDGSTDIPAMKLVKTQGGYSIAVHDGTVQKRKQSEKLLNENRVDFTATADYRKNSELTTQVCRVIDKIVAEYCIENA
ncbi:MAG: haloacid dehalogenase-like hydrolase [Opitutales bacterium]|nr:haloacid dehalogenase-like hydrolase [Opitutales bacterium]